MLLSHSIFKRLLQVCLCFWLLGQEPLTVTPLSLFYLTTVREYFLQSIVPLPSQTLLVLPLSKDSCNSLSYLPTPPLEQDMTQGQFKRSLTGFTSEYSFSSTSCLTKAEEISLSYYLPVVGGRIIGFIPFPRVLVLYEMQSVSSRVWTRVTVSISFDDSHYTMGTSSPPSCNSLSYFFF